MELVWIILLCLSCQRLVRAVFTETPMNTVVIEGQEVMFNCTVNTILGTSIIWREHVSDENGRPIAVDDQIESDIPDKHRYAIRGDSTILGQYQYNLVVLNTLSNDTGYYSCNEIRPGNQQRAYLFLLETAPDCTMDPADTILVEGDSRTFTCIVSFSGLWSPVIDFETSYGTKLPTNVSQNGTDGVYEASGFLTVDASRNNIGVTGKVYFPTPPDGAVPEDESIIKYDRRPPTGVFSPPSFSLTIHYHPREIYTTPSIEHGNLTFNIGDKIRCFARANPGAVIRWDKLEGGAANDTVMGDVLIIESDMVGDNTYECVAENRLGNDTIVGSFVIIPDTTTMEPTTTVEPTTTIEPTTTLEPTTTVEPTTTLEPTTTIEPTTTAGSGTVTPTVTPTAAAAQTGLIVGIVVGSVVLVILIGAIIYFCLVRRKKGLLWLDPKKLAARKPNQAKKEEKTKLDESKKYYDAYQGQENGTNDYTVMDNLGS